MSRSPADGARRRFRIALLVLLVVGAVTRFYRLGAWPLFGDEYFTLRDSTDFAFSLFGRPLIYWLNHHLVRPFLELDAFGLRLLAAAFGVAGVGVVAGLGRRLVNRRTGLLAGALVVLNPWHLAMSQFARYYTLVFLLAAISPAALYVGVREGRRGWLVVGVAAAVLGWFAHPTTVLPTAGFLVWLTGYAVVRTEGRRRRWLLGSVGVAAVTGLGAGAALLSGWMSMGLEWGLGGVGLAVSYGVRITAGPALAAAAGAALLWLDGRRELALFLVSAVAVPLVLLAVLGELVAVHTGYLFATAPYALLAAGGFLDAAARRVEGRAAAMLVGGTAAALVVATGLPSFVSHYVDGGKADFRSAARHVAERAGSTDLVLADHTGPFHVYAPSLEVRPLVRDTSRLDSLRRSLGRREPSGDLWLVPYVHSEGGFGLAGLGSARDWVWRRCRLSFRDNPVRVDHVRNIAEVWRCSAGGDGAAGAPNRAGAAP